jgi:acyl carrier protein
MAEQTSLNDRISTLFLEKLHLEVPSADTDLLETGALDSLRLVELLVHLEQEFGIKISLDALEIDHFSSITRVTAFIAMHKQELNGTGTIVPRI